MKLVAGPRTRPEPDAIWRTWLVTGARAHAIDRRRLRGAHRGIKQMLAEGGEPDAVSRPWGNFSHAMVRQHVNEAMRRLETRDRAVVTMAYFAGFTNTEIADELGLTARAVQRILSNAISNLSDAFDRSRRAAFAVVLAIASCRAGRWFSETFAPAAVQAVAAAVVVGAVAASPAPAAASRHVVAPPAAVVTQPAIAPAAPAAAPAPSTTSGGAAAAAPALPLAVQAPTAPQAGVSLEAPQLPPAQVPKLPKLLKASV